MTTLEKKFEKLETRIDAIMRHLERLNKKKKKRGRKTKAKNNNNGKIPTMAEIHARIARRFKIKTT